ncbi:hypothetical protein F441_02883 [Phytophthora nicotianae CJ01A1]|uniref:Uncharacterized protein n=3 Tax=Phytophthora nicotianae TaxID=4792 RepID=W2LTD1_PHYNI|nr:hypothetical protein L915_02776 [Phytophthora nicotianae]ETL47515.1 hypothetical protein L916_02749 [Phytophthora nicotianae]ETM00612.1 hypothetical protein L917_02684 [Phytophthora nicotianae]ETO83004.1 hypothetical protein F444_02918 [Phytophthora nicotianae P1976]ETP24080.1 hypothetical protein F441_02883 [Phytophthora nicotianae CJ01A1]
MADRRSQDLTLGDEDSRDDSGGLHALVGQAWTTMAPTTRKNDQDAPPPGGERQAQLVQLRSEIAALQANNQARRQQPTESRRRVQ